MRSERSQCPFLTSRANRLSFNSILFLLPPPHLVLRDRVHRTAVPIDAIGTSLFTRSLTRSFGRARAPTWRTTSGKSGEIRWPLGESVLFVARNAIRRASCLQGTRVYEEDPEFPCLARFAGVIQLISRNSGRRFLSDGFHSEERSLLRYSRSELELLS